MIYDLLHTKESEYPFIHPDKLNVYRQLDREKQWEITIEAATLLDVPLLHRIFIGDNQALDTGLNLITQFVDARLNDIAT